MAAAVLAMTASIVVVPFSAGAQSTAQDARQTLAVSLAEGLMEEILSKPFADPDGSSAGEVGRTTWDDMGDYNGYAESDGNIVTFDGTGVNDAAAVGLSRHVTVQPVYVSGQDQGQAATFKRATVEIRYHGNTLLTLTRLKYSNE